MISEEDKNGILEIQRLLDEAYRNYFEKSDGFCKSSEGHISLELNNYFDRRDGEELKFSGVTIYSYVLDPNDRIHSFLSVAKALETVRAWHKREMERDYDAEDEEENDE